ncbi:hypothetical protein Acsp01_15350 [Actinoplanes sp. NBRC 101535]|nr:hypothetical protein Acsp01_15350 [Actinoplanes sp. NBRC 101535]
MHAHVVADIDHRRHIGADGACVSPHAEKEPGASDAPGKDHDPHLPILPHLRDATRSWVAVYAGPTSITHRE